MPGTCPSKSYGETVLSRSNQIKKDCIALAKQMSLNEQNTNRNEETKKDWIQLIKQITLDINKKDCIKSIKKIASNE